MNFNSFRFLIFLPVVLILYWILPRRFRWVLLLAASYYFYMCFEPWLALLMLGTTVVSYLCGLAIEKAKKKGFKRLFLLLTVISCLGALIYFKYFNFFLGGAVGFLNLFKLDIKSVSFDIILPIGISFYTFQTLSYVIDVYKGKFPAERHFGYYALFVCFFPQLVAGPIERPGDLIPQLKADHKLNFADFSAGLRIMAVGFFYKCAVADVLAVYVDRVFSAPGESNGLAVLLAGFLFTVQMYCDFAGYSEIATGCARMMGIRLSRNFNRPYLSTSYSDFFSRWHMTLTRWFTDYVYIPLGGSRKGVFRRILNTFIVFLLCGLWHGANLTYLAWGAYAAFFLCLEFLLKKPLGKLAAKIGIKEDHPLTRGAKIVGMYILLIPAAIIFRSASLADAGALLGRLFAGWGFGASFFADAMNALALDAPAILRIALCIVCEVMIWHFAEIGRDGPAALPAGREGRSLAARRTVTLVYTILAAGLCFWALLSSGDNSAFAYFQF